MPTSPDIGASNALVSQRNVGVAAFGVLLVGAVGWYLLGRTQAVTSLVGGASPIGALTPFAAPADSMSGSLAAAPGERIVLERDPFTASAVYHPAERRVPQVRRSADVDESSQSWRVTAVLITNARRAAVINDSLVEQGGTLPGGARLTSVDADRVVVTDAHGGRHTITARDEGGGESL
jgi:hypothetical protein